MSRTLNSDILGVLKGLNLVINNVIKLQETHCQQVWKNSSIKTATEDLNTVFGTKFQEALAQSNPAQVSKFDLRFLFNRINNQNSMWGKRQYNNILWICR